MLSNEFKEFIKLLNDQKAEYLLIGGYAVVLHGYVRFTGDIDFWINPIKQNAVRLLKALNIFGFGNLGLTIDDFTQKDQIIQLGIAPNRIDLITSVSGLKFTDCYSKRTIFDLDGVPVQTISLEDLKKNKKTTGRYKDLDDLENL